MAARHWLLRAALGISFLVCTNNAARSADLTSAEPAGGGSSSPIPAVPHTFDFLTRLGQPARALSAPLLGGSFVANDATPTSASNAPRFPLLASDPDRLPGQLVHVRISRQMLDHFFLQSINREDPVSDSILDTEVRGTAFTVGSTAIEFVPSTERAVILVSLSGTVKSRTAGYNGPVVLDTEAVTKFRARKQVLLTAGGVHLEPASCDAETSSVTHNIGTRAGGVRGRILERVARRRVEATRSEADAIVSDHAAARICSIFDGEVHHDTAALALALGGDQLKALLNGTSSAVEFRTTPDYLEFTVHRHGATPEELVIVPPTIDGDADLALRAHRVVVRRLLANPTAAQLEPLLSGLLANQSGHAQTSGASATPSQSLHWSADRNWLVLDCPRPAPSEKTEHAVAIDKSPLKAVAAAKAE
jgi:hypothetical protein